MAQPQPNLWNNLEEGIHRIMLNLDKGLSYEKYMELYTGIYNHCISQNPSTASNGRGANLMGGFLYENLQNYLKRHLADVKQAADGIMDDALLHYYSKEWYRYTTASTFIHHVFRHWVKRELDEGHKNVYEVYTLCLICWRDHFFMSIQQSLMNAVQNAILRHRNAEAIDASLLKSILSSFAMLGLDENDPTRKTLDIYKKYFQEPFLNTTRSFYSAEAESFLASNSVVEYMRKVEARLSEEDARVDLYLDPSTRPSLIQTCETTLVTNHRDAIIQEFQILLDQQRLPDLSRAYSLMARIQGGLDPLKDIFEAHVKRSGLLAIEKLVSSGADIDPKQYVDALLEVYKLFFQMVATALKSDTGFLGSLDKACREFVNRNAFCPTSSKSPEYLARYSDTLLKKSSKGTEESDLDTSLSSIMAVFKYIEDKDVFQKFYSKMLAKRLVNDTSVSEESEESMINKLKEACGYEYTSKLSRMFTDMTVSKDLNDLFKARVVSNQEPDAIDFYIKVLATGSWPLQPPTSPFIIPPALEKVYTRFQGFYSTQHSGRKLTWLFHLSHGELKTNYTKGGKYIFMLYTYTMSVLLAFNDGASLSGQKLLEVTGLQDDVLQSQLSILLKAKVLLGVSPSDDDENGVNLDGDYNLNLGFKSKKVRVNMKMTMRSEQKAESEETHKTVEEDRKLLIQAAIVRIMKTRKLLKHVALIDEVITQLQNRFKPKIPDIKKCIDILLEKEYIERKGQEYSYLA